MTEQSRSQLQMMLVQQSGPGTLPLTSLQPDDFLEFLRKVEQLVLEERLSPVIVGWSTHSAKRLLPTGQRYRELLRDAFCYSLFSEDRNDVVDEWCFLVESQGLSLVVYGQKAGDQSQGNRFQCAGSLDPVVVNQAFATMLPIFQFVELAEATKVEDARNNLGPGNSNPQLVQRCVSDWPMIKAPLPAPAPEPAVAAAPAGPRVWGVDANQPGEAEQHPGHSRREELSMPAAMPGAMPLEPPPPADGVAALADDPSTGSAPANVLDRPDPMSGGSGAKTPSAYSYVWGGGEPEPEPSPAAATPPAAALPEPAPPLALSFPEKPISGDVLAAMAPSRGVFPLAAQEIIRDIVGQLRHSSDLGSILQLAIERLTVVGKATRGLIWQVIGDSLVVTNEYATDGNTCFVGQPLPQQESTAVLFEFLSRFPDESSGAGVISIPDTSHDANLRKLSPTLGSLIELGSVRARLVVQLRCRGSFSGFLELQECGHTRQWSEEDSSVLQSVCNMLSVVVQQARDQSKIQSDAERMELINEISNLFRQSRGQKGHDMLVKSVKLVAQHIGFLNSQIYLYNQDEAALVPQIDEDETDKNPLTVSTPDSPFVAVYEAGRDKVINLEYSRKGDPFFGHETAVLLPLVSESEKLGVLGLWQRQPNRPQLTAKESELAHTIAGQLASIIRADQAIAQIRADQARSVLINKVSSEIRQSLKEADQILETLAQCLAEYLGLALCVVSQYDGQAQDFIKSKSVGALCEGADPETPNFGEHLILSTLESLKAGQTVFMTAEEIKQHLGARNVASPPSVSAATLVPLIHAGNLKSVLCMVAADRQRPFPEKDMQMVADLADRVAVVISHAELFAQVERQAITDPMTGLYNRRHFAEQFSKEMDRYKRFGHPFSYIIVDLDFLKKINDNLGHQFGDAAIKHIAQVLKRTTRDVDTAARYGGEEFTILLPVTDVSNARIAAERVCVAIREAPVEGVGVVTASVGVATFPHDTDEREKLTDLADQALYLAKHRGRNQVCSVSEDLVPSLSEKGEEALEVQKHTIQKKADELPIDLNVIAEHGILGLMGTIIKFIEAKDAYSKDRSPKAAEFSSKLAQSLRLSKEHITIISLAAVLNNLGKIALPQEILQKKGPLTPEERKVIEQSPLIAAKILEPAKHLHRVASVVEAYHEHWDGTGYPKGLKGEDIPLESRIIALVDAYIAMTSDRPYRPALSHDQAVAEIQKGGGKEWDPRLVRLFLSILQKERAAAKS